MPLNQHDKNKRVATEGKRGVDHGGDGKCLIFRTELICNQRVGGSSPSASSTVSYSSPPGPLQRRNRRRQWH
jgi:hypothetical protein